MSRALFEAEGAYLHSPVDDLESFFWVAFWSVFFNKDTAKGQTDAEKVIKDHLVGNRKAVAMDNYSALKRGKYSDITHRFRPILLEWWRTVRDRQSLWTELVLNDEPDDANGEYYLPHFHRFAVEGVVDVLKLLAKHWDDEISWESWTGPTLSM